MYPELVFVDYFSYFGLPNSANGVTWIFEPRIQSIFDNSVGRNYVWATLPNTHKTSFIKVLPTKYKYLDVKQTLQTNNWSNLFYYNGGD